MEAKEMKAELFALQAENAMLKAKVSGICKVYSVLRPVLKVVRIFSFLKKGGKAAIDAAIALLDGVCELGSN